MRKKIALVLKWLLLSVSAMVALLIFVPRHYAAPPVESRYGTKYLNLSTGSRIAFTLLPAKGSKKPFPVIYLHGGPGGAVSYLAVNTLTALTEDGYDVLLYDQVGGGASNRLTNITEYTVDRHISDLSELIRNTGSSKVILLTQSWGGVLAAYYVGRHPNDIAKIIFTNPGPLYPYPEQLRFVVAPDSLHLKSPVFTNAQGNNKSANWRTKAMKFLAMEFGIRLASDEEADAFSTVSGFEINKSTLYDTARIEQMSLLKPEPRSGYYAEIMTFKNLLQCKDPRPALKAVDIPVLVLKSQYDNQPWGGTNEYLELFKHHRLTVIPNAGHAVTKEQPLLFIQHVRQFLNE